MVRVLLQFLLAILASVAANYIFKWIHGDDTNLGRSRKIIVIGSSFVLAIVVLTPLFWLWDSCIEGTPLASWQLVCLCLFPISLGIVVVALCLTAWKRSITIPRPSATVEIPQQESQPVSHAKLLEQDLPDFVAETEKRVLDEATRDALILARETIQKVAVRLDRSWERGRHALPPNDVRLITVLPDDRLAASIVIDLESIMKDHLRRLPYAIESARGGEILENPFSTYTWVINPLEGGRHLTSYIPLFATTITLVDGDYNPVISMVYVPSTGELFFAAKGCGAYLNDWNTPLPLPVERHIGNYIYVEFPNRDFKKSPQDKAVIEQAFNKQCDCLVELFNTETVYRVRGYGHGSIGLAYVAKGSFAVYVTLAGKTRRCNVLAGTLLVSEAYEGEFSSKIRAVSGKENEEARCFTEIYAICGRTSVCDQLLNNKNTSLKEIFCDPKEP